MEKILNRKILFIIPARQGSVGVPGKNVALVGGIPCLGRTILACKDAMKHVDAEYTIFCSTNSNKFKAVAESYGAYVPFLRPQELACGKTSTIDVIRHVLKELGTSWSAVVTLQCTVPFTNGVDIQMALEKFENMSEGTLVSVKPTCPEGWMFTLDKKTDNIAARASIPYQRQENLTSTVELNGAIYVATPEHLLKHSYLGDFKTSGLLMPASRSIDIDEPFDLLQCQAISEMKVKDIDLNTDTDLILCLDLNALQLEDSCENLFMNVKQMGYKGLRILVNGRCILNFPTICTKIFPIIRQCGLEIHCNFDEETSLKSNILSQISSLTISREQLGSEQLRLLHRDMHILLNIDSIDVSVCVLALRNLVDIGFINVEIIIKISTNLELAKKKMRLLKNLKGAVEGRVGIIDTTSTSEMATIFGAFPVKVYERYVLLKDDTQHIDPTNAIFKLLKARDLMK
jgi:CMP-N-acetylneuraminic acid synthetase